jgi:ubiquinone/menaquinone biosynthesis C-methylase UbiE
VVPLAGALLSRGPAYRYLSESVEQFVPPERLADEIRAAGFATVAVQPLTGGVVSLFTAAPPPASPASHGPRHSLPTTR